MLRQYLLNTQRGITTTLIAKVTKLIIGTGPHLVSGSPSKRPLILDTPPLPPLHSSSLWAVSCFNAWLLTLSPWSPDSWFCKPSREHCTVQTAAVKEPSWPLQSEFRIQIFEYWPQAWRSCRLGQLSNKHPYLQRIRERGIIQLSSGSWQAGLVWRTQNIINTMAISDKLSSIGRACV